ANTLQPDDIQNEIVTYPGLGPALANAKGTESAAGALHLALFAAGVAAFIPGILKVKVGNWLRASGAMAVFATVYFYSPAMLPDEDSQKVKEMPATRGTEMNHSFSESPRR
ncbi:MAG: hypothetical protein GY862_38980, partial [Gammaproteobacteria bacterium]|nr:hypothetical protein [Gammaproteobacteria bacterium]